MKRNTTHIVITVLLLALVSGVIRLRLELAVRGASTIVVPDDYSTIQGAVNGASGGDTIFVRSGTYYEHVVVSKALSLVGENRSTTVVDGNWTGVVIRVTQNSVNISGLTVRRSGSIYWENAGVYLDNVEDCNICESIVTENPFAGLELDLSRRCVVSGNTIFNNSGVGITVVGGSFNDLSRNSIMRNGWGAITLNNGAHNNTISENNMTSNNLAIVSYCINLYQSSNNTIKRNNVDGDDGGIRLEYGSNYNTVAENNVANNTEAGVSVETYSDGSTISSNVISGSRFGVVVNGSTYADIHNNTIAHNHGSGWGTGLYLDSAGYTLIHDNEITDNWRAIHLIASSPNVSIYRNNVAYNEFGIRVLGGGSNYLKVSGNYIANNLGGYGVGVTGIGGESGYAAISGNVIVNNIDGIVFGQGSNHNMVFQNSIGQNEYGIGMQDSTQNSIYSNSIMDNIQQTSIPPGSVNSWDNGYPSGGNYWSDYDGGDLCHGLQQDESGSDGIGDTPCAIDSNNRDNYPRMKPYGEVPDVGILGAMLPKTIVGKGYLLNLSLNIVNYGSSAAFLNVTIVSEPSLFPTQQIEHLLMSRDSFTILITCNTTGLAKGNCTIHVFVDHVSGETDLTDNNRSEWLFISIPGDTAEPYRLVDIFDVVAITGVYESELVDHEYKANSDIDGNGLIDIFDVVACTSHYEESW
jgi:parallel beta-helix repeat protein